MSVIGSAIPPINMVQSFLVDILRMERIDQPDHHAISVTFRTEQGLVSSFGISKALGSHLVERLDDALQEHAIPTDIDLLEKLAENSAGTEPKLLAIWRYMKEPMPNPPPRGLDRPTRDFLKIVHFDALKEVYILDMSTVYDVSLRISIDPFLASVFRAQLMEVVNLLN